MLRRSLDTSPTNSPSKDTNTMQKKRFCWLVYSRKSIGVGGRKKIRQFDNAAKGEPVAVLELVVGRLLLVDVLSTTFRTLTVRKDESCPVCGIHPTVTSLIDYEEFCGIPASGDVSSDDSSVPEMTVWELKARRDLGDTPFVLDVRNPFEAEIADLGADQLIPVEELFDRLGEIHAARDWEIVVHCRTGGRSAKAVNILLENGFGRAANLKGDIRAWSEDIDATVLKY